MVQHVTFPRSILIRALNRPISESVCLPDISLPRLKDRNPTLGNHGHANDDILVRTKELVDLVNLQDQVIQVLREAVQEAKKTMRQDLIRIQSALEYAQCSSSSDQQSSAERHRLGAGGGGASASKSTNEAPDRGLQVVHRTNIEPALTANRKAPPRVNDLTGSENGTTAQRVSIRPTEDITSERCIDLHSVRHPHPNHRREWAWI
jgi:hypothetical protein